MKSDNYPWLRLRRSRGWLGWRGNAYQVVWATWQAVLIACATMACVLGTFGAIDDWPWPDVGPFRALAICAGLVCATAGFVVLTNKTMIDKD